MQKAAQALNQREAELRDSARQLESQRGALDDADRVITKRRIESAAYQRQVAPPLDRCQHPLLIYQHPLLICCKSTFLLCRKSTLLMSTYPLDMS